MRPIATINGVDVYSDKQTFSVNNSLLTFADGSWCDVTTGEIVKKGAGFISIRNAGQGSVKEEKSSFTKSFPASSLEVRDIEADVEIQPCSGSDIIVTIEGNKSKTEDIQFDMQGNSLVLSSKGAGRCDRNANVFISVIGNGVNIISGRTMFMGGARDADVKVLVEVPISSSIQVVGVQGDVRVGNTDGLFIGSLLGDTSMTVGRVRDTQLSLQGSGDINVYEVNGNLNICIQGSGDVKVSRGIVSILNVSVMGSGDVNFSGTAVDASLSVMGSGDINVQHVQNRPNRSQMGSGSINIRNWKSQ